MSAIDHKITTLVSGLNSWGIIVGPITGDLYVQSNTEIVKVIQHNIVGKM